MANLSAIKLPSGTTYTLKDNNALPLTGGSVTGPVSFGDSVTIDDLTAGQLVVDGALSVANNLQANTINGVTVGASPKFTDTVTTVSVTGTGNAVTAASASNGAVTLTKGATFLTAHNTYSITNSGSGNAVTAVSLSGTTFTVTKGTTFLTSHQDISGKADKSATVSNVAYDSTNAKITKTINGTTSDVVTVATLKTALGSMPASDVYSWAKASTKPSYAYSEITGTVPSSALPSYVDDVLEYTAKANFPTTGETGKIYVDTATNLTWRWGGSAYVEISPSLALGTTSSTAYRGDYGNTAYTHATDANRLTTAKTSGFYKIATTAHGHVQSVTAVAKSDITALGIPAQDTTYGIATYNTAGLVKPWHSFTNVATGPTASALTGQIEVNAMSTTAGRYYPIIADKDGRLFVNVPWTENTNTTYTLSGALASHKFTTTLTPSSGSATTSDFTLAAGTGISITDDTTNRKMTIACSVTNTDTKVTQAYSTANTSYPLLMSATEGVTSTDSRGATTAIVNNQIYAQPGTGELTVASLNVTGDQIVIKDSSGYNVGLTCALLSTNRAIEFPNKTGTIALTSDIPSIPTVPTITLNGTATTAASFYAPTSAGTSGYYLKSSGSGAPTWTALSIPSGNILYGTSAPGSSTGANGDIYCVYTS